MYLDLQAERQLLSAGKATMNDWLGGKTRSITASNQHFQSQWVILLKYLEPYLQAFVHYVWLDWLMASNACNLFHRESRFHRLRPILGLID